MKRIPELSTIGMILLCISLIGTVWAAQGEINSGDRISRLTIGTINQINDANPWDYYFGVYSMILSHQGLVRFNNEGDVIPDLATSWETDDLQTWTFYIRDNATWHDGKPVKAQDFKFTVDYDLEKDPLSKSYIGAIKSVEAPDDNTVIINLEKPDYNFLNTIAVVKTIPEHIFKSVDDPKKFNEKEAAIGSGPYKFVNFDKNAGIVTYKANENYWGGMPAIDEIELRMFKNPDALMLAFQKGEIDLPYYYSKGISYYYVPKLLEDDDIRIEVYPERGITNVFWFNTAKAPFDNKELRQAFSYAVNYEELKNMFTAGYGTTPTAGWVPEGTLYYTETRTLAQDINKSKSMLDSLGFKDINGDGLREMPDGSDFQPKLLTRSDLSDSVRAAEMLKKYFADVGIDIKIDLADKSTHGEIMDEKKTHEISLAGTTFWGMTMGEGYGTGYTDIRNYGWSMVSEPEYQSLVDDLGRTKDKDERRNLAAEIQNYYAEEMPQFTIYSMNIIQPYNARYAGWEYNPLHGVLSYGTLFNLHEA
ncbi:MAG TPA: ABC transporter substrate-binding protein [Methanothrix sp.]|jgi:peptide/nickel transport system substrate-binding protein|uniref:ABC transporter substrate-binding protein n=1 Tax=Methanothrix sp. TaxID=90426 RepID=UPI002C55822F|nr:ABC transporter substrate-binding protein [Methanothrix sp.]MDI9417464.1 ABC transporter substrate-binding protein [Euryarchaeota archaeon]HON36614.1 ABC transporter substrate-binding protein [Methanothrix sp.]HRU76055.1 ABC transporter substrate-binding protein [Methanothrix sp.]